MSNPRSCTPPMFAVSRIKDKNSMTPTKNTFLDDMMAQKPGAFVELLAPTLFAIKLKINKKPQDEPMFAMDLPTAGPKASTNTKK